MPTTLRAMLSPKNIEENKSDQVPTISNPTPSVKSQAFAGVAFLQEVKSFKSLNIELSWR